MIITKKTIARRAFLRGAGTAVALPLLDAMIPAMATPLTAAKPAVKTGFLYVPNGVIQKQWLPTTEGAGFEFQSTMKPLEPFRDKLTVLSGLAQNNGRALGDGSGDHGRAGATWLTGVHPKKTEGNDIHAAVSADQYMARQFSKTTPFGSLELGLEEAQVAGGCDSGYSCAYTNTISWRSPTTPNPVEVNPRAFFERLFGDGDASDPATRLKVLKRESSILDYVRGDLARLKTSLGMGDNRKLEEYTDGIRDIEQRLQLAEKQTTGATLPVITRPSGIPPDFGEHFELMTDMLIIALQTDMTRVFTFMLAREGSNRSYPTIGVADGHHSVTHHMNDPEKIAKAIKINEFHVKNLANLIAKLQATPDGDGTLLDHSMLLYGSSLSDGNSHTHDDLPLVLIGGAAGQLKGGNHIRYHQETPMTNLLVSMMNKAGLPTEKLGDSTGMLAELSGI